MFCEFCGTKIADDSAFCPSCGKKLAPGVPVSPAASQSAPKKTIDNIFSALAAEKSTQTITEFVIWICFCVAGVACMIAGVTTSRVWVGTLPAALWLVAMLGNFGIAVALAFRQHFIALISGYGLFNLVLLAPMYFLNKTVRYGETDIVHLGLFAFDLLIGIGLVAACLVHQFAKVKLNMVIFILSSASTFMTIVFFLVTRFILPRGYNGTAFAASYGFASYTIGGFTYIFTLLLLTAMTFLHYMSSPDRVKETISVTIQSLQEPTQVKPEATVPPMPEPPAKPAPEQKEEREITGYDPFTGQPIYADENQAEAEPAVEEVEEMTPPPMPVPPTPKPTVEEDKPEKPSMGTVVAVAGVAAGQGFRLPETNIIIVGTDSSKATWVINDDHLSAMHCSIRYQASTDVYTVTDSSINGTFVGTKRLEKGVPAMLPARTILSLADGTNQIKLG